MLDDLASWLAWTTWKQCKGCKDDELCSVPIWPHGKEEDFDNPVCVNSTGLSESVGYWGRGPGVPGRRPDRPLWKAFRDF
jgi:hypothetical protein